MTFAQLFLTTWNKANMQLVVLEKCYNNNNKKKKK